MKHYDLVLHEKYIADDTMLMDKLLPLLNHPSHNTIVLKSPVGSGKSFLLDQLKAAIVMPTTLLANQHAIKYAAKAEGIGILDHWQHKQVVTYKSCEQLSFAGVSFFAIDEAHKIIEYAAFVHDLQITPVLETIDRAREQGIKILFVSATPEKLVDYYCFQEQRGEEHNPIDCVIDIHYDRPRKLINTLYIYNAGGYIQKKFRDNIISSPGKGKHIAIYKSKDAITRHCETLCGSGINVASLTSEDKQKQANHYLQIAYQGTIEEQMLLATTVIDCGINLYDQDITDLYCAKSDNLTLHKQFLGRARNCLPNYHLQLANLNLSNDQKYGLHLDWIKDDINELVQLDDIILFRRLQELDIECSYDMALFDLMQSLRDMQQMSTIAGVVEQLGRFCCNINTDRVDIQTPRQKTIKENRAQKQKLESNKGVIYNYLLPLVNQPLKAQERKAAIAFMNEHGQKGKRFKDMAEKHGFTVVANKNGSIHRIIIDEKAG